MAGRITVDVSEVKAVREAARPLGGSAADFDPLLKAVGQARFVLVGEASHGTHEFYRVRAELTKRLLAENGFGAVAIEGDWPDAWRVNRYVRGRSDEPDAGEALAGFRRFPTWMWRNADVLDFVGWLRAHNEGMTSRGPWSPWSPAPSGTHGSRPRPIPAASRGAQGGTMQATEALERPCGA